MNVKSLGMIVGAVIAIVLFSSVLLPIVSDAQKDLGTPVTATNTAGAYLYSEWDGSDMTIEYVAATGLPDGLTINGETTGLTFSRTPSILIASNDFAVRTGGSSSQGAIPVINYLGETATSSSNRSFTIEITDGAYSLTVSNVEVLTGTIDWLIVADVEGDLGISQVPQSEPFYMSESDNFIVLGSIYVTGENDTFYSYYNGDLTVNADYADVSSISISKELAEGFTDIYDTTVIVTIGEETFTPFYILAPLSVSGHAASGANYSLVGVIPIIVIVGIILAVIGVALTRYE